MKRPFAELWGTGSYAPPRVMTNDEFSKILDTSDEWIQERTGIRERRVSSKEETNACMGKAAALQVLNETGLTPLDIERDLGMTEHSTRLLDERLGKRGLQYTEAKTEVAIDRVSSAATPRTIGPRLRLERAGMGRFPAAPP